MNQKAIKELQKLLELCMEINEKTEHDINFHFNGMFNPTFSIKVWELGYLAAQGTAKGIADCSEITLKNIKECRQKLLKYKEW